MVVSNLLFSRTFHPPQTFLVPLSVTSSSFQRIHPSFLFLFCFVFFMVDSVRTSSSILPCLVLLRRNTQKKKWSPLGKASPPTNLRGFRSSWFRVGSKPLFLSFSNDRNLPFSISVRVPTNKIKTKKRTNQRGSSPLFDGMVLFYFIFSRVLKKKKEVQGIVHTRTKAQTRFGSDS